MGINTDTPQATLEVVSKENSAATSALKIKNSDNNPLITVSNAGRLGIQVKNPSDLNGIFQIDAIKKKDNFVFGNDIIFNHYMNGHLNPNDPISLYFNTYGGTKENPLPLPTDALLHNSFYTGYIGNELQHLTSFYSRYRGDGTTKLSDYSIGVSGAGNDFYIKEDHTVGIRTNNPTATLDINGTARVRELKGNVSDTEYTRSIVADANGNLGYVPRTDPTILGTTQLVQGNAVTTEAPFPNRIRTFHDYKQHLAEGKPNLTRYMGQSITLPPGKWVIYYGSLFIKYREDALVEQVDTPSGEKISVVKQPSVWVRTRFYETKEPQDFLNSQHIVPVDNASSIYNSVELTFTGRHTPLYGTFLITLTETKTIYLHAFYDYMENFSNEVKGRLISLGRRENLVRSENYLYAIKRY
ncbi:hypothetical protein [Candidatus Ornithobacterium hominis]|uniref:hypothetical protein n=1 Tax=Candidatus Ornithobacterium hominis TaxID=2497989 RepID=UPI0024BC4C7D|nr:hypothetical protein [Candidatus Ornithobacterium hominis]